MHLHFVADEKVSGSSVAKKHSTLLLSWKFLNKEFLAGRRYFQTQLWQISQGVVSCTFKFPLGDTQTETKSGESKKLFISSTWSLSKPSALLPFFWHLLSEPAPLATRLLCRLHLRIRKAQTLDESPEFLQAPCAEKNTPSVEGAYLFEARGRLRHILEDTESAISQCPCDIDMLGRLAPPYLCTLDI